MENKARVLGYYTSKKITNEELKEISGGTGRWTVHGTHKITGAHLDVETDQILD